MFSLKKMSIPKAAVLATGLTAAVLVAMLGPSAATASPSKQSNCTGCHNAGGSVKATPASATQAPNASYKVALAYTGGDGSANGFWISGNGVNVTGSSATTATMTAPAAAGTYTYTVWVRSGVAATTTYSITVSAPTSAPTVTPTVAPTVVPPVAPPVVAPTVAPPVTSTLVARIRSLSTSRNSTLTIRGNNFGTAGVVKLGNVTATVSSWTNTSIVVRVPGQSRNTRVSVTVTPTGAVASNAVRYRLASSHND